VCFGMATTPTKPGLDASREFLGNNAPAWPRVKSPATHSALDRNDLRDDFDPRPSGRDALQALLAFSALHEHVRRRRALAARHGGFEAIALAEFESGEQFVLDEVLQLVAERAIAITGADGLAIALAENNDIVLRASAGAIKPDVGARIDRDSAFSGACFRTAQIVRADDTETDDRVNLQACRRLGARSMVAVPLCGRRRVIGLLEAFSADPFGFNDSDVRSLELLAEIILGALKPEDEDRFAEAAQVAATQLDAAPNVGVLDPSVANASVLEAHPAVPPEKHFVQQSAPLAPEIVPAQAEQKLVVADLRAKPALDGSASTSESIASAISEIVLPKAPELAKIAETEVFNPEFAEPKPTAPKPVERKIAEPKLVEPKLVESPVAAAILDAPAVPGPTLDEPKLAEVTLAEQKIVEPETELEHPAAASSRHGVLLALVLVVIIAVLAGGVWLKLNNEQLGSSMVQSHKPRLKPLGPQPSGNTAASQSAAASSANPDTSASQPAADSLSAAEPAMTPATTQELSKFPRVTGIRHWSSADAATTVVIDLEDQVQYEYHHISGPDRTYFDLRDTALAPEWAGRTLEVGDALLNRIRVAQPVPGMTRIVLETKADAKVSVSLEPNPYRLVLQVNKIGATPNTSVDLFPNAGPEKSVMAIVVPPPTKEDLQLRAHVPKLRIAVDAGHGGWDLGTVGRRGLLEKDLVLEVAERLGKLLESRLGAEIIYTRQDDNYIPLDERAGIANQAQADLFVSVHANYSDLPSARGVETYYTNFFSAPNAKDVDTRANANGKPAVAVTLTPAELHEKIEQSRRLADSVQRSLYGTLAARNPGLRDRGVKEASFVVLTETSMPGILAEVSFVSSPTDEQKLRSDGYREQIAEALYKGIARYAASSRGVKVASAGK
jgi:N-acetylmuramoyl-L-alanine amidase/putative methionine-R-sulfoxide reductase with GAF domain